MDRRRLLLVVAAVGAGAVLVVLGQRWSPEGAPDQAGTPAGAPARAPASPLPSPPLPSPPLPHRTATPTPTQVSAAPAIEDGPVTGAEELDPAELPDALRTAERFAARWSTPDPDWHDRVAELATPALAAELAGADPPRPAPELTGPGQLYLDAPEWARIGVPAVGGTLVLDVVATGGPDGPSDPDGPDGPDRPGDPGGGWLVSAVDWWPG